MADDSPDGERRHAHDLYDEELVEDARVVRPYALTRGRTRSGHHVLPLEALVGGVVGGHDPAPTTERRRICELSTASRRTYMATNRSGFGRLRASPSSRPSARSASESARSMMPKPSRSS